MDIFDVLSLIGGLCMFLFGMNVMGKALERRAGDRLRSLLAQMTTGRISGFLTGCGITAIIQSSSATTVMVVGFVNSGLMDLRQAINVIMGSNVGTTITAWVLSLSGISGDSLFVQLLKPSSFVPVIALIGIMFLMMGKDNQRKETGTILLGFAVLMFGMETMSAAASGLAELPSFQRLFILFENPVAGLIAGAVLTAIIQSSSAAVGILQVLAITGSVTFGAAIPIIIGTCIGTCVTAMLSSIGAKNEARRTAMAHLSFNVLGAAIWIIVFMIVKAVFDPAILNESATLVGIAFVNTAFNVLTAAVFLPMPQVLETIVKKTIPDEATKRLETEDGGKQKLEDRYHLDDRLLVTPTMALDRCEAVAREMAQASVRSLENALTCLVDYSEELDQQIRRDEDLTDDLEDILGTYLVKLSSHQIGVDENEKITALLKIIGDYERIADHSENILESAIEAKDKKIRFTQQATYELGVLSDAVTEATNIATDAFMENSSEKAKQVEPLEQVVDSLKEQMRTRHILRMKEGICSIDAGFIWSDLLTNMERVSDHCSNIAGCIIDMQLHNLNLHETIRAQKENTTDFEVQYRKYADKYQIG